MPTNPHPARVVVIGSYAEAFVVTSDRIPLAGETLIGRDFRKTHGGKGSDMAVQAARLGAHVDYVGVVGDDAMGRDFVTLAQNEGIDTSHLRVTSERATGVGLIVKDELGRNVIVVDIGANELLAVADVDAARGSIAQAGVVLAQREIPLEAALYAMRVGRELGAITVFNPAPAIDLRGLDLSDVDILTPNETEARVAVGRAPDDPVDNSTVAAELRSTGAKTVVMTLGEKGSAIYSADGEELIPAWRIEAVDSNGAGDSFNAALSTALAEGRPLAEAAHFAGLVAGLCCTEWETVPSYHTRAQVEKFRADALQSAGSVLP